MANFTTLIFDFDGTLGDTLLPHLDIYKKVARDMGIDFDENEDLEELRKLSAKGLIKKYKLGPIKLRQFIKKSHQELNKTFDQIEMFPGMEKLLKDLAKNYRLGILSSNSQENIEKFVKAKNLEIFDFIYTGQNMFGKDKIFKKILKNENLGTNEILYFGDELRDINACQKLGIKIAAVTWGFDHLKILEKAKPDYLISEPKEIKKLLAN